MKPLTKEEISFIRNDNDEWIQPDWTCQSFDPLTEEEKEQRKRYFKVQQSLAHKGILKMTQPGMKEAGGYMPALYNYTELGKQISGFILENKDLKDKLKEIRNKISDFVGL